MVKEDKPSFSLLYVIYLLLTLASLYVFNPIVSQTALCIGCNESQKIDSLVQQNTAILEQATNINSKLDNQTNKINQLESKIVILEKSDKISSVLSWINSIVLLLISVPLYLLFKKSPNKTEKKFIQLVKKYKWHILIFILAYSYFFVVYPFIK